jgi:DNA polymerase III subunit gamma/tau
MVHLWKDLMRHVRNLVVAKVCTEDQVKDLLDLAEEEVADVLTLAQKSDADDLTRIFTGLSRGFDDIVKSGQVRSNLEMTLVRLARRPALLPLDELLSRLGELEKRLATGAPPPPPRGSGPAGGGGGGGGSGGSRGARPESHASITSAMPSVMTPPSPAMSRGEAEWQRPSEASASTAGGRSMAAVTGLAPLASTSPSAHGVAAAALRSADDSPRTSGALAVAMEVVPAPPPAPPPSADSGVSLAPPPAPRARTEPPPASAKESEALIAWRILIDRVRKVSPPGAAMLDLAIPLTVTPEKLVIGVEDESFEDVRAEQTDARAVLMVEARAHFGVKTEVVFEHTARGSKVGSVAYLDAAKRKQMQIEARAAVENHVLVQHAIRIFGAELKDVKLPAQEE